MYMYPLLPTDTETTLQIYMYSNNYAPSSSCDRLHYRCRPVVYMYLFSPTDDTIVLIQKPAYIHVPLGFPHIPQSRPIQKPVIVHVPVPGSSHRLPFTKWLCSNHQNYF